MIRTLPKCRANGIELTNAMGVLLNATVLHSRKVIVDHVLDIADIDSTSTHTSCN
jgi:hypothetical protein